MSGARQLEARPPVEVPEGRGLLHRWVARQAARRPDARAVVGTGGTPMQQELTYGELESASNRLARILRAAGCGRLDRVCLLLPKSPAAIVGILGTLKAGCVYVPLDLESPGPRLADMVRRAEPAAVLATAGTAERVAELREEGALGRDVVLGWLDGEGSDASPDGSGGDRLRGGRAASFTLGGLRGYPDDPVEPGSAPDDPAYVFFTSGSTGTPKGVVISHANVVRFVEWGVEHFGIGPDDRLSAHPPLHFDLSVFDMYAAFAAGAELHLVPRELNLQPAALARFIRERRLTQWFSVPSLLNYLARFDVVERDDFPALRRLLWCGEVFPTPALAHWMERLPHVSFTNLYGPTETTVASSYHDVEEVPGGPAAEVPIGTACAGEDLVVLDGDLEPLPAGEVGDLYIRGAGVGLGYWRDEERTREAFLPDPFAADPDARMYRTGDLAVRGEDGLLYFRGREDHQIKSRGHRIELGEVESAFQAVPGLAEIAVVPVASDGFEGTAIGCAYSPRPGVRLTPSDLRARAAERLPGYMVPSRWRSMERLPRNKSGKIDRRALSEMLEGEG